jgi:hypothetical protein
MKWKDLKKAFFAIMIALGLVLSPFSPATAMNKAHCDITNNIPMKHDSGDKKICCVTASVTLVEAEVSFSHSPSHYKQTIVFSQSPDLSGIRLDADNRPPKA